MVQVVEAFNESKAEAFAQNLLGILNSGALALMTSIGHRTGLFDAMGQMQAATSQEIADAAGLNERYVREWLGAMVTGGFIEHNALTQTYFLPPEHAAFLTREATPNNIAVSLQLIPLLASVEDEILDCFEKGGGLPYSAYDRFHEVMAEDSAQTVVSALKDGILPLIPDGIDRLNRGIDVLDLGCGRGRALMEMASLFPNSNFTGIDFSKEAIADARSESTARGLTNIEFRVEDAAKFNECDRYDLIFTFDAIHDQAHPDLVLQAIHRALRKGGTYLMQDIRASSNVANNIDLPVAPFLYTVSCLHCMSVSLAMGGMGLGTMWGEELAFKMLRDAGFIGAELKQLDHDIMNNYYLCRKN